MAACSGDDGPVSLLLLAVVAARCLAGCGHDRVETPDGAGEDGGGSSVELEPTLDLGPIDAPAPPAATSAVDPAAPTAPEADDDGTIDLATCSPLQGSRVEHAAFHGGGCDEGLGESALLATQDALDARAAAYCQACWYGPTPCPEAPELEVDTAVIYVSSPTFHGPAEVEIVSIHECEDLLVVEAAATMGCETAFSQGWDSLTVPAIDKPLQVHVELIQADCFADEVETDG